MPDEVAQVVAPDIAPDVTRALRPYRVMAFAVGVMLLVLVGIAVPLQYAAGKPALEHVVGPAHGALYTVYLVAAANLARRARFTLWQLVAVVMAGFVPGLAFVVEHRTTRRVRQGGASTLDAPLTHP